jgi:uncharacterized membrane protein
VGLYTGSVLGVTPVAGVANSVLETVANAEVFIKELTFGGEVTTSTAMRTRLARDSAVGTGSRTAGNVQKGDQHTPANLAFFSTTYATTQPTIVAGCVWGTSWNAHGGVIRWLADPTYLLTSYDAVAGNASLEVRQDVGTATSSFVTIWLEP